MYIVYTTVEAAETIELEQVQESAKVRMLLLFEFVKQGEAVAAASQQGHHHHRHWS